MKCFAFYTLSSKEKHCCLSYTDPSDWSEGSEGSEGSCVELEWSKGLLNTYNKNGGPALKMEDVTIARDNIWGRWKLMVLPLILRDAGCHWFSLSAEVAMLNQIPSCSFRGSVPTDKRDMLTILSSCYWASQQAGTAARLWYQLPDHLNVYHHWAEPHMRKVSKPH